MKSVGEIVLIQEDQRLEVSCDLCLRPDQDQKDYVVRWSRALALSGRERFIQPDGEKFQIIGDTLVVHRVSLEDVGEYYCTKNGGLEIRYVVDVVLVEMHREVVEPGMSGNLPAKNSVLKERNLKLTTRWLSWSECDKCGRGGQRRRIGVCTVLKNDHDKPVAPLPIPTLDQFVSGVPCRSSLLPPILRALNEIAGRDSEIMIGKCFLPCPSYATRTFTDATGKVVDSVQVEEKYFDVGTARPTFLPLVSRKSLYEKQGVDIVLDCPHKSKGNVLIRWQNGTNLINPATIKKATNGRVTVDIYGRLHIKSLQFTDTRTMSCWTHGRLVATMKLVIVGAKDYSIKDYVVYAGCGMVGLTILIIAIGVCAQRNKKTMR
ncbi:Ig-like V-type domain-containing protein FAM187A [Lineus longissimus]|uniref:Ig-like V-type domain-containing protein FAM187A n=1 Tax=Lineus longissimus TaxID=88925 RepID=UPI00315DBBC3